LLHIPYELRNLRESREQEPRGLLVSADLVSCLNFHRLTQAPDGNEHEYEAMRIERAAVAAAAVAAAAAADIIGEPSSALKLIPGTPGTSRTGLQEGTASFRSSPNN